MKNHLKQFNITHVMQYHMMLLCRGVLYKILLFELSFLCVRLLKKQLLV